MGSVAAAALLAACSSGGSSEPASDGGSTGLELASVEVAGVGVDVPVGWSRRQSETAGFAAYSWLSPASEDGTRVAVSIDVACSGGADVGPALDGYLASPQFPEFAVRDRQAVSVGAGATAERFEATYSLPIASTGVETPAVRHGVMAVEEGVAALVLVEGVTTRVSDELVDQVLTSLQFDAATDDRIAACATATTGS